jgi:hypothetical protein
MFLTSLLLSVVTLAPAAPPPRPMGMREGMISAGPISPDKVCQTGDICASTKFNQNGCLFVNYYGPVSGGGTQGGTPLTLDVTQTGGNGKPVYIYWVNATNTSIKITGAAQAKYYCPT